LWRHKVFRPGIRDEFKVAQFYSKSNFPLAHRWKSKHSEIDLLFFNARFRHLKMVEVKSCSGRGFEFVRISTDQRRRLLGARKFLESFAPGGCELLIAQPGPEFVTELSIACWQTHR
jgi:Holliday junction resolvase-like predicted endonuclease